MGTQDKAQFKIMYKDGSKFFDGVYFYIRDEKIKIHLSRIKMVCTNHNEIILDFIPIEDSKKNQRKIINSDDLEYYIHSAFYRNLTQLMVPHTQDINESILSKFNEHIKVLEKLKVNYFLGSPVPIMSRDNSKKRWIVLTILLLLLFFISDLFWVGAAFGAVSIIPLLFYYENKINNYYTRKFRSENFYNIQKELIGASTELKRILNQDIPEVDPDTILYLVLKDYVMPSDVTSVRSFTALYDKDFYLSDLIHYYASSNIKVSVTVDKHHGYLVCCINIYYLSWTRHFNIGTAHYYLS